MPIVSLGWTAVAVAVLLGMALWVESSLGGPSRPLKESIRLMAYAGLCVWIQGGLFHQAQSLWEESASTAAAPVVFTDPPDF
jgi:hypothetical protein